MKKYISILLAAALLCTCLCACGSGEKPDDGKLKIVTTVFPVYDWTVNILGDPAENAEVTMLLDSGTDLHSYQPSADDLIKIANCDVFIYVGGESDEWAEDAVKAASNEKMTVVDLMDTLGDALRLEERKEGMEGEAEEEAEYDEHIWLSLKNAVSCCEAIEKALASADAQNAGVYADNLALYSEKIGELSDTYASLISEAKIKTLLFADRFPFRYLTEDYGLDYFAAFSGCSAESEASFETVSFLAGKLSELKLPCVLILEGSDTKMAQTVIQTAGSNAQILSVNSMQSVTAKDVKAGASYLDLMAANLIVLQAALGVI